MAHLTPQTIESAPQGSKETLQAIQKRNGFISNLMATFASSPALLNGYVGLDTAWEESSSFTAQERELIFLAASVENRCRYCIAAHATALKGLEVNPEYIQAVRNRESLGDLRLDALVTLTRELVAERGFVAPKTWERFVAVGFDEVALMEVLIGVALKVISNYLDNLAPIAIDAAFRGAE
jgi:uncharacterized peroxidase-related enzyme